MDLSKLFDSLMEILTRLTQSLILERRYAKQASVLGGLHAYLLIIQGEDDALPADVIIELELICTVSVTFNRQWLPANGGSVAKALDEHFKLPNTNTAGSYSAHRHQSPLRTLEICKREHPCVCFCDPSTEGKVQAVCTGPHQRSCRSFRIKQPSAEISEAIDNA